MISLKEKYKDIFKIGVAVNEKTIVSHKKLITKHFNSITCDYVMKYRAVCNYPNDYDFTNADKIYNFAVKNDLAIRGHALLWHLNFPEEFNDLNTNELLSRTLDHIEIMGNRYPKIYCWDVINEGISDNIDTLQRKNIWYRKIGEDYMNIIFKKTKEKFPKTELYYNEMDEVDKADKIFSLISFLQDNGSPVDGLGLQCHINVFEPSIDEYRITLEKLSKLNIKLQITEFDVSIYDYKTGKYDFPPVELLNKQATIYNNYFQLFRDFSDIIDSVTIWGIADDKTWLDSYPVKGRKDWPTLFDVNHEPKEAFYRIVDF